MGGWLVCTRRSAKIAIFAYGGALECENHYFHMRMFMWSRCKNKNPNNKIVKKFTPATPAASRPLPPSAPAATANPIVGEGGSVYRRWIRARMGEWWLCHRRIQAGDGRHHWIRAGGALPPAGPARCRPLLPSANEPPARHYRRGRRILPPAVVVDCCRAACCPPPLLSVVAPTPALPTRRLKRRGGVEVKRRRWVEMGERRK